MGFNTSHDSPGPGVPSWSPAPAQRAPSPITSAGPALWAASFPDSSRPLGPFLPVFLPRILCSCSSPLIFPCLWAAAPHHCITVSGSLFPGTVPAGEWAGSTHRLPALGSPSSQAACLRLPMPGASPGSPNFSTAPSTCLMFGDNFWLTLLSSLLPHVGRAPQGLPL